MSNQSGRAIRPEKPDQSWLDQPINHHSSHPVRTNHVGGIKSNRPNSQPVLSWIDTQENHQTSNHPTNHADNTHTNTDQSWMDPPSNSPKNRQAIQPNYYQNSKTINLQTYEPHNHPSNQLNHNPNNQPNTNRDTQPSNYPTSHYSSTNQPTEQV